MADRDPTRINDLCVYAKDEMVGYMPLDDFGGQFEITAIVKPDHRRQGIFRAMLEEARRELVGRKAEELLLVNYRASESGCAVIQKLGFPYESSEYCMAAEAASIPALPSTEVQLTPVTPNEVTELSGLLERTFADDRWNDLDALQRELENPNKAYYIARLGAAAIGQIGTITQNGQAYIRAVGILPEFRGHGCGRQLLAAMVTKLLAEGCRQFELDVATDNSRALSLYHSCGFHETNIYDYYNVPIR